MRMPPRNQFRQTITQETATGFDAWGKPLKPSTRIIPNVFFHHQSSLRRSGINQNEIANAVIIILEKYTPIIPTFKVSEKIFYDEKTFEIKRVVPLVIQGKDIGVRLEVV